MPPKPLPKGKPLSKKELLDLLCVTLEKLREKAEVILERARQERSLDHMTDAEDTLDKAYERESESERASERESECVCVCVCVCACVRACVCVREREREIVVLWYSVQ